MTHVSVLIYYKVDIEILWNEHINKFLMMFLVLFMTFLDHAIQPHS